MHRAVITYVQHPSFPAFMEEIICIYQVSAAPAKLANQVQVSLSLCQDGSRVVSSVHSSGSLEGAPGRS